MLGIVDRGENRLRLPLSATLIPGFFSPLLHGSPIPFENWVLPCLLRKRRPKARAIEELGEVMCV